ncbi:MAG: hypothetical protein JW804_01365 [Sedimentisphaerales bacterium]|nr:hypothetical protein [Sedimentisphaerales bacterium]
MGLVGDFLKDRAFYRGKDMLGIAEAFEQNRCYGPACRLYVTAADKVGFGGAIPHNVAQINERANVCREKAELNGEDVSIAWEVVSDEIIQYPNHFLRWYYAQQKGPRNPWRPPTYQELAEEKAQTNHAQIEAESAQKEEEKARRKQELETVAKPLFKKRYVDMLNSAAQAADGSEEAFKKAISLYRLPSDRKDWGQAWAVYARSALQKTIKKHSQNPKVAKALQAMPRIAYEGDTMSFRMNAAYMVGFCLLYPVCKGLMALFMWVAPESEKLSFIMSLFWAGVALIMGIVGITAWILKWIAIPVAIVWTIVLIVYFLPRSQRAKRAMEAKDITLLEIDTLFKGKEGTAIQASPSVK